MFGGLGVGELFVILLIILVLFGAKRVPEIGASIGKGIREFKRSVSDVENKIIHETQDSRPSERLNAAPREESRPEPKKLI